MTIVLGIDPGSRVVGFGVIQVDASGRNLKHVAHGVIDVADRDNFNARLVDIGTSLEILVAKYRPNTAAIEDLFLGKNPSSIFKLGHARGVCLYEIAKSGIPVANYSTREIKMGITGSGASSKELVQKFVSSELRVTLHAKLDASDALAVAMHHARQISLDLRFKDAAL
jgi:crossover junction endodeoxyribonuclease RuvC